MINASNYVCATTLENLVLAKGATGDVLDQSASMLAEIERRCGTDVAMLFAQPTIKSTTGSTVVSWYAAPDGSPRPLASFDAIGQRPFTEILRARLARLFPVMADPVIGASIGAALNIRSFQDIYVMGRDVVIVNWGMLPRDVVSSETAREAHFRKTLGSFAPSHFPTPPFDFNDAERFMHAVARELKASAGRDAAEARDTVVPASQAPQGSKRSRRMDVRGRLSEETSTVDCAACGVRSGWRPARGSADARRSATCDGGLSGCRPDRSATARWDRRSIARSNSRLPN